jgi:hypothetical protein
MGQGLPLPARRLAGRPVVQNRGRARLGRSMTRASGEHGEDDKCWNYRSHGRFLPARIKCSPYASGPETRDARAGALTVIVSSSSSMRPGADRAPIRVMPLTDSPGRRAALSLTRSSPAVPGFDTSPRPAYTPASDCSPMRHLCSGRRHERPLADLRPRARGADAGARRDARGAPALSRGRARRLRELPQAEGPSAADFPSSARGARCMGRT